MSSSPAGCPLEGRRFQDGTCCSRSLQHCPCTHSFVRRGNQVLWIRVNRTGKRVQVHLHLHLVYILHCVGHQCNHPHIAHRSRLSCDLGNSVDLKAFFKCFSKNSSTIMEIKFVMNLLYRLQSWDRTLRNGRCTGMPRKVPSRALEVILCSQQHILDMKVQCIRRGRHSVQLRKLCPGQCSD